MTATGLTITIGCPGAGKSTWADKHLPEQCLRLERDRFREAIFGSRRAYHDHSFCREIRSEIITEAMLATMDCWPTDLYAVTDTGLAYGAVSPFIYRAVVNGLKVRLVVFKRSPEFLLTNNRIRPLAHRIPEDILLQKIEEFNDPAAWWKQKLDGCFEETLYV